MITRFDRWMDLLWPLIFTAGILMTLVVLVAWISAVLLVFFGTVGAIISIPDCE